MSQHFQRIRSSFQSPMSTWTPLKSVRTLATGHPRSSVVAKNNSTKRRMSSGSSTGMMATVMRLSGRSSLRILRISLYTFALNRFPCSIIVGKLLTIHNFNSSKFATRHQAEILGLGLLALGGDGRGLGSALEGW